MYEIRALHYITRMCFIPRQLLLLEQYNTLRLPFLLLFLLRCKFSGLLGNTEQKKFLQTKGNLSGLFSGFSLLKGWGEPHNKKNPPIKLRHSCRNLTFRWPAGCSLSIPSISGVFLSIPKFSKF